MQKISSFVVAVACKALALAGVLLVLASGAAAHPGHGLGGGANDVLHYVSDPLHVAPWALAVLALAFVIRRRRPRSRTRG